MTKYQDFYAVTYVTNYKTYHIERDPRDYEEAYHWDEMIGSEEPYLLTQQGVIDLLKRPTSFRDFPEEMAGVFNVFKFECVSVPTPDITAAVIASKKADALAKLTQEEIEILGITP